MAKLESAGAHAMVPLDADAICSEVDRVGYAVVPEVLDAGEIDGVRRALAPYLDGGPRGRNEFEGHATQRVYSLIVKSRAFDRLVLDPTVLAATERVLGPNFLLTAALAINVCPGEKEQSLHFDDAFYPIPRPRPPVSVSTLWAIDPFTETNGATVACPGSHRWGETVDLDALDKVTLVAPAGSLVVYSGTLFHAGGANASADARLAVSIQYAAAWARQQENFQLALGIDGARELPERLQALIGYSIHSIFMGMVDGRHPCKLLD
jgi:ectoine hydroxylase-related dioxygenase (phytanoyl-CoA dioxygenase family)